MMALDEGQGALFEHRLAAAAARNSGTTNGTDPISAAQKAAMVQLIIQLSLH